MTIEEKAAYIKGLADGLGIDPQSKEGTLWRALNDLLSDIAHDLKELHATDLSQAEALDSVAEEVSYLEALLDDDDNSYSLDEEDDDDDDEDYEYDGVLYDAICPNCGEEITFDEETLELGSIQCPSCGETLEFDLDGDNNTIESDNTDLKF